MRDELIIEKIKSAIQILDEIDEMIKTQPTELQTIDYELSDLYHLIENNDLSDNSSLIVIKRIHELRKIRRSLNNEYEIESTYKNHLNKLTGTDTRKFLTVEIHKTSKNLNNLYKNRILTEEDINKILNPSIAKRKPGRPKKEDI